MIWKYWDFWWYFFGSVVNFAFDLSKVIFGKNIFFVEVVSDFVIGFELWANTSGLLAWKFFVFCTFDEKFWFSLKKSDGSAELSSNCPRDCNGGENYFRSSESVSIDFVCLAESSTGFLNLHSLCREKPSGEKDSFREKRSFCHHFCSSANNFATWLVENGGFIKSDFFFSVVSLEKIFIF